MASSGGGLALGARQTIRAEDLLLRETHHRASNDLQLVVSLLALQSRRADTPEARGALADAMERVAILARARSSLYRDAQPTLERAVEQICEALGAQGEPRGIDVSMRVDHVAQGLCANQITTLTLVINELATNAIKHAYTEGRSGRIRILLGRNGNRDMSIIVDDDGLPFPDVAHPASNGLGLELAKRLMASIGGLFIPPPAGSKAFELRVPVEGG